MEMPEQPGSTSGVQRVDSTETPDARREPVSTVAPAGDVRLTVNLRADLHVKLKIRAVQERSTMGELIEAWIRSW